APQKHTKNTPRPPPLHPAPPRPPRRYRLKSHCLNRSAPRSFCGVQASDWMPPLQGCFFYGFLSGAACAFTILLITLLGFLQLKRMFDKYADDEPLSLLTTQMSPLDFEQLQRRPVTFQATLRGADRFPLSAMFK